MHIQKVKLFFILFLLMYSSYVHLYGQGNITCNGSWDLVISSSDMLGGAGSNLNSTYTSASDQVLIGVWQLYWLGFGTGSRTWNWAVDVNRSGGTWHGDFVLSVRRTGSGTSDDTYSITDGTNYQPISTIQTELFQGTLSGSGFLLLFLNADDIPVQYQLSGVSATIPANNYSTTIVYTVRDN